MRDFRLQRTMYLLQTLDPDGHYPGGREALIAWIRDQLDAGESDVTDPRPGDRAMADIIERFPKHVEEVKADAAIS